MLPYGFTYSFTQREAHAACGLGVAGYFLKYGFKVHARASFTVCISASLGMGCPLPQQGANLTLCYSCKRSSLL